MDAQATNSSTGELLERYHRRSLEVLSAIDLAAVARVVDVLADAWGRRALVAIAGNGGSASTAEHMATDLVMSTRVEGKPAFRAISLTDNAALLTALSNDRGYDVAFADQLDGLVREGDVVILISASGSSPNVVEAAQRAREQGATPIALVGFDGGKLASICDPVVHVRTEPGEYGPVEDAHLLLDHMITGALRQRILAEASG
jgi:D-sedoheptulose 7-phosphate isomerase